MRSVYLDYNGSAPLDPRVLEAMLPVLKGGVGNASSGHGYGRAQALLVEEARAEVASLVGGTPSGVVFTSGATEANNLALQGLLGGDRTRLVVSAVEHASVRSTANWIADAGLAKVDTAPVHSGGDVNLVALEDLLNDDVALVSVMAANGETGILNLAHRHGAAMHCDATQMVGRLPFDMTTLGVDMASISSHKICGPTGSGALVLGRRMKGQLRALIHGGGHEKGLRSGSLNVSGLVGFGEAARLAAREHRIDANRISVLRDNLVECLRGQLDIVEIGDTTKRLPNTASLRFVNVDGEAIAANLDPVAVSTGSACSSGSIEPSHVLLAMGLDREAADQVVRFSLGRFTTEADVELAVERTIAAVSWLQSMVEGGT